MKPDQKKLLLIGGVVVLVLLTIYLLVAGKKGNKPATSLEAPTEVVVPTVDSNVKVDLISSNRKEATLIIRGIPSGTNSIEYVLSYGTVEGGLQGINSTITLANNEREFTKQITLGTCSSGTCVYHNIKGKIKVELKFNGNYGEKIYEKEYEI